MRYVVTLADPNRRVGDTVPEKFAARIDNARLYAERMAYDWHSSGLLDSVIAHKARNAILAADPRKAYAGAVAIPVAYDAAIIIRVLAPEKKAA